MLLQFAERLNKVDEELNLVIRTDGNLKEVEISNDSIGTLYSYSTTNLLDLYNEVNRFIECLEDTSGSKFEEFLQEILQEELN